MGNDRQLSTRDAVALLVELRERTGLPETDSRHLRWENDPSVGYIANSPLDNVRYSIGGAGPITLKADASGGSGGFLIQQDEFTKGVANPFIGAVGAAIHRLNLVSPRYRRDYHLHQLYVDAQHQYLQRWAEQNGHNPRGLSE